MVEKIALVWGVCVILFQIMCGTMEREVESLISLFHGKPKCFTYHGITRCYENDYDWIRRLIGMGVLIIFAPITLVVIFLKWLSNS